MSDPLMELADAAPADELMALADASPALGDVNQPEAAPRSSEPYFTAGDMAPRANYVQPRPDEAQRMADVAWLAGAMRNMRDTGGRAESEQVLRVAQALELPRDVVAANLPAMAKAAEVAGFDAEGFMRASPELWRVLERTRDARLAQLVVTDKELSPLTKLFREGTAWLRDLGQGASEKTPAEVAAQREEIATGLQRELAPRQALEVDSPEARAMRGSTLATVGQRWRESKAGLEVSRLGFDLMVRRAAGADTTEVEAALYDAQQKAQPLALGDDSGLGATITAMVQGTASTTESLVAGGAGAAAGAAVGGAIGAAAGAAAGPGGAVVGAKAGAAAGAKVVGGAAVFASSLRLEAGSSYLELGDLRTEEGKPLTEAQRFGAALVAGALKAGIEVAEVGALLKTLGPAGAVLTGGGASSVATAVASNPSFRKAVAEAGAAWAKAAATEGLEEGAQTFVDQATALAMAGKPLDTTELLESTYAGTVGALPLGLGGTAIRLGVAGAQLQKAKRAGETVKAVAALAGNQTVQAAPEAFAQVVAEAGEAEGEAATHLYVDAKAVQRFFQGKDEAETQQQLELALGPDGPQRVQEALATGQRLEVPVETVLATWANSEVGKATVGDTTTAPGLLTPAELAVQGPQVEADAQALAEAEVAKASEKARLTEALDTIEVELEAAGMGRDEAKQARTVWQHFWETQAEDAKVPAADLAERMRATFKLAPATDAKGQLSLMQEDTTPEASRVLSARVLGDEANQVAPLDAEGRARDLYIDDVSGLRTEAGWEFEEDTRKNDGTQVAVITSPDVKPINDAVKGGHDTTNRLLTLMAGPIAKGDEFAARLGPNFALRVADQAALDAVLAELRAVLPKGIEVRGALGVDRKAAGAALDAVVNADREAGTLPARGKSAYDVGTLTDEAFASEPQVSAPTKDMLLAVPGMEPGKFFTDAYLSKKHPTLLNRKGFELAGPKDFVASLDLRGLKLVNDTTAEGDAAGDAMMAAMEAAAGLLGASRYSFAHLSGDEYAAKADSKEELARFLADLDAVLSGVTIPVRIKSTGEVLEVRPRFRSDIGEKTYGAADRALNAAKAAEPVDPAAGRPDEERLIALVRGDGRQLPGPAAVEAWRADSERRGDAPQAFAGRRDGRSAAEVAPKQLKQDEEKTLLVQHNLSVGAFRHMLKMGGLAAPSLAVANKKAPLAGYGAITLLGDSSLVDPSETPVFDSDVYSPRYPTVSYKLKTGKDGAQALEAKLAPTAKRWGLYTSDLDQQIQREGLGVLESRRFKSTFELAWLATKNFDFDSVDPNKSGPMQEAAEAEVDKLGRAEFDDWARAQVSAVIKSETVSNGGRRLPHTLENVLRLVTKKIRQGEGFDYGNLGSARANGSKRFRSLKELQAARAKVVSKEEFEVARGGLQDRFDGLVAELEKYSGHGRSTIANAIGESYLRGRTIAKALDVRGIEGVPAELVAKLEDFAADLVAAPTEYFEAKPQRIVKLQEFTAAVVPASTPADVMEALRRSGLDVETYIDDDEGAPGEKRTQRQAAVAALAAKNGLLFQEEGNAKGWVDLPDRDAVERVYRVFLSKQADVSTVLHESAHAFLDMLEALATGPKASPRTQETWAQARAWLGLEEGQRPGREHHEKWARSFEAWLMEGKAPARGLVKAFTRMRGWLVGIYRAVMGVPGAALNDEVRAIFSRLLATDAELESYKRALGPRVDMAALGVDEVAAQEEADEDAHAFTMGTRRLELALLREKQRQAEKAWKKGLAEETAKAEGEYEVLPARVARRILEGNAPEVVLANTRVTLEKAYVDAVLGEEGAKRADIRTSDSEDAVHPDEVAGIINGLEGREVFATGAAMLRAVVALPSSEAWVKGKAQAAMEEREPSLARDRVRMRALLADGLHGAVERRMLADWAALTAKVGGRQPAVEALKRAAKLITEKRTVRGLRVNDALRAQRVAANAKAKAAAKGEWAVAIAAAQQEMLNGFLYRELLQAQEAVERLEKDAKAARKLSARARAGKASPKYRDAVDYLQAAVGLSEDETHLALGSEAFFGAVDELEADGQTVGEWVDVLDPVLGDVHYEDMTVAQVRAVAEAMAAFRAAVVNRTTVLTETGRVDKEEVVEQLVKEARSVLAKAKAPGTGTSDTFFDKLRKGLSSLDGFLSNPIDLVRDLTGDDLTSTWRRVIVDVMRDAKHREAKVLREVVAPLLKTLEEMPKAVRARADDAVDGPKLFPGHVDNFSPPRRRHELWVLALNAGNESNLQRLTDGRRISEAEVAAAIDTLTDEELAWVQQVWDQAETLRDDAFDLEERDSGLRPQAVEARPLRLPSGRVLKGGYFPAIYEANAGQTGERQQADALAAILDPTYTRPGTPHSHTKRRASKVTAVLSLSTSNIYRHFSQVAHDLAYREALKSVGGLVLHPDVDAALRERLGAEKTREFMRWLKAIGGATSRAGEGNVFEMLHQVARAVMPPAVLGYRTAVAAGDFANLAAAVATTPLTAKHLGLAVAQALRNPREAKRMATEKSRELRHLRDELARQFQRQVDRLSKSGPLTSGPLAWWRDHAFVLQETVADLTATPVWLGAYNQATQEGRDEAGAVAFADDVLTRVFPQSSAVERAGILTDRGVVGMTTMFYGYMSLAYRQTIHPFFAAFSTQAFEEASPAEKARVAAVAAAKLTGGLVAVGVLGEFLMGRGPDDKDRDDEEPSSELLQWRNWFARKLVMTPVALVPFGVGGAIEAALTGRPASPRSSPAVSAAELVIKGVGKVFDGDAKAVDRVVAGLKALGLVIPTTPLTVQGRYLYDVATGARPPSSGADVASGLVYGERNGQPLNPITAVEQVLP